MASAKVNRLLEEIRFVLAKKKTFKDVRLHWALHSASPLGPHFEGL